MFKVLVFAAFFGVFAQSARALENWIIIELGPTRTEALCLQAAQNAMLGFARTFGMRDLVQHGWAVFGWGLADDPHDAVITCGAGTPNTFAMLTIYSARPDRAQVFATNIQQEFVTQRAELESQWLQNSLDKHGF